MVAAKAWAALSAVSDWAAAIRQGKKQPQPKPEPPSLWESLKKLAEVEQMKKRIAAWTPRRVIVGQTIPESGEVDDYQVGSPERAVVELLHSWRSKNYGKMASILDSFGENSVNKRAGDLRETFGKTQLRNFKIIDVADQAPAVTVIQIEVSYIRETSERRTRIPLRLIYQDKDRQPCTYPSEGAMWIALEGGLRDALSMR